MSSGLGAGKYCFLIAFGKRRARLVLSDASAMATFQ